MAVLSTEGSESGHNIPGSKNRNQGSDTIQVVVFTLADEHFAIDLFDVKEVVEYTTITRLPNVPLYIKGIIDLRGEITTIIDLKYKLNIAKDSDSNLDSRRIIVLDDNISSFKIGILVDDVTSVSTFEKNQIDSLSKSLELNNSAILGIIKRSTTGKKENENELIIWIDVTQLVNEKEPVTMA